MLLNVIKSEIRRTYFRWQTLLAFFLLLAFFIQGYEAFRPNGIELSPEWQNFFLAFLYAQGKGPRAMLAIVLPLVVALTAGDSLAWDRKTGFNHLTLMRSTYKNYILGKIIGASITSFVFVFISEWVAFLYGFFSFPKPEIMQYISGISPDYAAQLFLDSPYTYILLIIFNTSLLAMVISLVSVFVSVKVKNIFVVTAIPFLLFILLQFAFNILSFDRYAPIDLVGTYMLSNFKYPVFEIPVIWIVFWLVLAFGIYSAFTKKYKREHLS